MRRGGGGDDDDESFRSVTFGNGLFVAVGTDGIIETSTDGRNFDQGLGGQVDPERVTLRRGPVRRDGRLRECC